jgi:pimeloyl-ACP methyl ester carboxylesterase
VNSFFRLKAGIHGLLKKRKEGNMTQDTYPLSQLHIEQRGNGPRVVFVHGGEQAGGLVAFGTQLPLANAFTLILPDLPGHGQSPAQGHKNVERDAHLIAELLADGAHLVGHSYGGAVALKAATERPEAVRSITLIEPAIFDIAQDDPDVHQVFVELAQATAIPDLRARLEAFATAVGIHKTWSDPLSETYRRLAEDLPLLPAAGAGIIPSRQLAEQIAAASIPSLVISGGHRVAFEKVCDVLAGILNAQRAVFSGYGHVPQQIGEPFNSCVEQFWSQLPS